MEFFDQTANTTEVVYQVTFFDAQGNQVGTTPFAGSTTPWTGASVATEVQALELLDRIVWDYFGQIAVLDGQDHITVTRRFRFDAAGYSESSDVPAPPAPEIEE